MKIDKNFTAVLRSALRICKNRYSQQLRCLIVERLRLRAVGPLDELVIQLDEPVAEDWSDQPVFVPAKVIEAALSVNKKELKFEPVNKQGIWTLNGVTIDSAEGLRLMDEHATAFRPPSVDGRAALYDLQLDPTFYGHLARVAPARANDDIRMYLTGLLIDIARRRIVATNGHRLHCAEEALPLAPRLQSTATASAESKASAEAPASFICGPSALAEVLALCPQRLVVHEGLPSPQRGLEDEPPLLIFSGGEASGAKWRLTSRCLGGTFPDTDRVVNALPIEQQQEMILRERARPGSRVVATFPVSVTLPNYAEAIDHFIKATLKACDRGVPTLVLDLRKGTLRSVDDAPVAFSQPVYPIGVNEEIERVLEDDSQALCGVQAPYLRDAMKALGDNRTWTVSAMGTWQSMRDKDLKVLVMPTRLGTGR